MNSLTGTEYYLLWTWHNPTENWPNSGICLKISSVTKCTPRCCGRKLIFRWNHAEPICIPRWLDEAMLISYAYCWQKGNKTIISQEFIYTNIFTLLLILFIYLIFLLLRVSLCSLIAFINANFLEFQFVIVEGSQRAVKTFIFIFVELALYLSFNVVVVFVLINLLILINVVIVKEWIFHI